LRRRNPPAFRAIWLADLLSGCVILSVPVLTIAKGRARYCRIHPSQGTSEAPRRPRRDIRYQTGAVRHFVDCAVVAAGWPSRGNRAIPVDADFALSFAPACTVLQNV